MPILKPLGEHSEEEACILVAIAQMLFPVGGGVAYLVTGNDEDLPPGDGLCLQAEHVFLFLCYPFCSFPAALLKQKQKEAEILDVSKVIRFSYHS